MRRRIALAMILAAAAALPASDVPARHPRARHENQVVTTAVVQARKALFEDSQLDHARQLAQEELRHNPADIETLFIEMEAAALQADTTSVLHAALNLGELSGAAQRDPRVAIAMARMLDLAANTEDFRPAIPRIQAMLARFRNAGDHPHAGFLRTALAAAAADGAPGINLEKAARESGVMTAWRVAGPFGHYGNLEFDQHWAPEQDALAPPASDGHAIEQLHFADGTFRLPDYFARNGVFYAAAETTTGAGRWIVRAETAGTIEVLVDGAVALRKDDRFRASPEIAWRALRLKPGRHHVLVKFLASAAPFRIAFLPAPPAAPQSPRAEIDYAPEAAYVAAAHKYWAGDYHGVISGLDSGNARSAAMSFLAYKAWTHVSDDSPETTAMLNATLQAAPSATAAEYELAARALAADRTDEALNRLQLVITVRENFQPGQQLLAQIAIRLNWPVLAEKALDNQLRAHPSCDVLLQGYKFFAGHARYERARELRRKLASCAPDTLAYMKSLSESGEHQQAAAATEAAVARRPLDRSARELLVRELALTGALDKARTAAQELAALAPNSPSYRRMAQIAAANPEALLDDAGLRASEFGQRAAFYAKYRRDGVEMVRRTGQRKFSGGPAVMLVNDRVARLWDDGSVSVYIHKLTRVLDRDGIEKYGEADIPRGAEVLELRTIKADGSVAEPEFTPQKATVSMPALAPGNAIDQEYVVHYPGGGIAEHAAAFRHTLGSFNAPILYSRFVAITPASDASIRAEAAPGISTGPNELTNSMRVHTWEKDDIPQSVEEVATARGDVLPVARLESEFHNGWIDVRDRFRNELATALRIGPRVERVAARVRAQEPQARAREIFRTIANSIRPAGAFNTDNMTSAEQTLASLSGSRTIAVLAVARAAGLDADLVLGRNAGNVVHDTRASLGLYSRPLVRFRFGDGREMFADAETEGMAFGSVPPSFERQDALLVPAPQEKENDGMPADGSTILSLPANSEEQSVAEGDVTLDDDGSLQADVTIRLGAWRAAQMRSILAGIDPAQRPRFYHQLAVRIFAGADDVTGSTRNERDPDRPLELVLHCRAPRYVNLAPGIADMDQLVPTLGLRKMYSSPSRKFPLFIDTPLVESAAFRLHLPPGVSVLHGAPDMNVNGPFGSYSLSVRQPSPTELDIQRSFRIPVQVIAPERFPEFSTFAAKIDEAERQRITLEKD
jgi:tetratricopeptide (TPR) repeat protein